MCPRSKEKRRDTAENKRDVLVKCHMLKIFLDKIPEFTCITPESQRGNRKEM
jgi:hypothetical protein